MKKFYSKFYRKITTVIMLIAVLVSFSAPLLSIPSTANAVYPTSTYANFSPTELLNTVGNTMTKIKTFVLDRLAYVIAKQILHQITASVISWINSGFKGSPAFLTNPGTFFTNVADQITGAFIQDTGILKGLCSPFSLDIRLSLALNEVQFKNDQYTCTFKTIVNNARNADITLNGTSIKGFVEGDFSKGGWPAFITMTTQPQNNAYGAWLTANSDLQFTIDSQKAKAQANISIGQGFMNFEVCSPVAPGTPYSDPTTGVQQVAPGPTAVSPILQNSSGTELASANETTRAATLALANTNNTSKGNGSGLMAAAANSFNMLSNPVLGGTTQNAAVLPPVNAGALQNSNLNGAAIIPNATNLPAWQTGSTVINPNAGIPGANVTGAPGAIAPASIPIPMSTPTATYDPIATPSDINPVPISSASIPIPMSVPTATVAQTCHTETPGSVIAGKLMKNVNSPEMQLELANDINSIISALVTQLTTQLLKGLNSMSKGSGGKPSYATQLFIDSATANKAVQTAEQGIQSTIVDPVQQYKNTYDTAVSNITDSQTKLQSAQACLTSTKIPALQALIAQYQNQPYYTSYVYTLQGLLVDAQTKATAISNDLTNQLSPMLSDLTKKQASSTIDLQNVQAQTASSSLNSTIATSTAGEVTYGTMANTITGETSNNVTTQLQNQLDAMTNGGAQSVAYITASQQSEANTDLTSANKLAGTLNQLSAASQSVCAAPIPPPPGVTSGYTTVVSPTPITPPVIAPALQISSVTQALLGSPAGSQGTTVTINGTGFTPASTVTLTSAADATLTGNPITTYVSPTSLQFYIDPSPITFIASIVVSDGGIDSSPTTITVAASP